MREKDIRHLYHRVGFGILPNKLDALTNKSKEEVIDALFRSSKNSEDLNIELTELLPLISKKKDEISKSEGQELRKKSRKKVKAFNTAWINRLVHSEQILREKMTLFWANVFVARDNHIFHMQQYNNTLRRHALGNFGAFVKAVAKEPTMSKYLNNRQNSKQKPNENFARELLELFTLGNGNYTEQDIKETARAFTGWAFKPNGNYYLRSKKHDFGNKTFFGETGNFDGEDIIDIILKQKQCARFICSKIYRYFVHPSINKDHLDEMIDVFYPTYDIDVLMRYVLMSDWFYDEKNMGAKIKSPIELLVGIQQIVPLEFKKQKQLLNLQKVMGQVLLYPPNVAGWKQDKNWIDSNTLLFRIKLPSVLINNTVIRFEQKGEFEDSFDTYYARAKKAGSRIEIEKDWSIFDQNFRPLDYQKIKENIIIGKIDPDTSNFLENLANQDKKEYLVQLMSLPEYQLC